MADRCPNCGVPFGPDYPEPIGGLCPECSGNTACPCARDYESVYTNLDDEQRDVLAAYIDR